MPEIILPFLAGAAILAASGVIIRRTFFAPEDPEPTPRPSHDCSLPGVVPGRDGALDSGGTYIAGMLWRCPVCGRGWGLADFPGRQLRWGRRPRLDSEGDYTPEEES